MAKIKIETEDLSELISAFNNAIVAYNDIYGAKYLGCYCPSKYDHLSIETIERRMELLRTVYEQLLEKEGD